MKSLHSLCRFLCVWPLAFAAALGILDPLASSAQDSWGYNFYGQLGVSTNTGTTNANSTPIVIPGFSGATRIAGGVFHTLVLKGDGTVWACGYNGRGALGTLTNSGTSTANPTPLQASVVSNVKAIAAGNHSLALESDGTVWAWGSNQYGQLGNTTNNASTKANPTPVQVSGLSGVTAIAAGWEHSLALKSDGTVWAWGYNYYGQLGNDTNTHSSTANPTPAQVAGLPPIAAIAAGQYHSLALAVDGTVWAWGWNHYGQLGNPTNNGNDTQNPVPSQVAGVSGIAAIAGGAYHTMALTATGGNILAWGYNFYGQLGNSTNAGTAAANPTPAQITALTGVTAIAAGDFHSMAVKSDGTVWTWGQNVYGELGNGTHIGTATPTPVQAIGLAGVFFIAGGMGTSFAIPPATVPVTIASSISNSTFSVTGAGCQEGNYSSPQILQWLPGSACSVNFTSPQSGTTGTQYVMNGWADGSLNNPRTIMTPSSATTYTAQFQTQYLLSAGISPAAGGFVSGTGYYDANSTASISATANPGYNFVNWSGGTVASPNSASTNVQMSGPVNLTANFTPAPISVTIASSISGLSFTVGGSGCQAGTYATPQTLSWSSGSSCVVGFAATQSGGAGTQYVFTGWEDGTSTSSRTINAPAAATNFTVNFQTQYLLTVSANPAGAGTVTGGGYYNAGAGAPVTAAANSGFAFANWSGAVSAAGSASTSVVMSGPLSVTANFNAITTIASAPAGLTFSVTGSGCQSGSYSTPQPLNWTPGVACVVSFIGTQPGAAGTQYVFSAWEDGPAANPRTIAATTAPTTLTADFQTQYQLTVNANPAGAGSVSGGGYYNAGTQAPVTAAANSGFAFVNWTGGAASAGSAGTSVTMTGPMTVTANFSVLTTIVSSPLGMTFSVSGAGCQEGNYTAPQVLSGAQGSLCSVSFGATQAGGIGTQYVFAGWSDGPAANPRTFTVSNSAATYTANFQKQHLLTTSVGAGGVAAGSISAGGYYNEGAVIAVSAVANAGYQFTGFSGDLGGATATQSITMAAPKSVTANFGLVTSVSVSAVAGKYSDPVSLSATILPAGAPISGTLVFSVGGVPVGSFPVTAAGTYMLPYVITQKQGIYALTAVFNSSTPAVLGSSAGNSLTVGLEDAVVTASPANPAVVMVNGSGAATVTLSATIQETPDTSWGDIAKAAPVTFTLTPAVAAAPLTCSASSAAVNNSTTGPSLTVTCTFANVPVNLYDVAIAIGGDYYTGVGKSVLAVSDPTAGFVNSNADIVHNGAAGSEKTDAKFRNDGSLQGSFVYSEQRAGGQVTVSAATLQSLTLVGNTAVLVAPAFVNGAGGYTVRAFFVSNAGSGKNDQFGMQVTDLGGNPVPDLTFAPSPLTSGNIQVH